MRFHRLLHQCTDVHHLCKQRVHIMLFWSLSRQRRRNLSRCVLFGFVVLNCIPFVTLLCCSVLDLRFKSVQKRRLLRVYQHHLLTYV